MTMESSLGNVITNSNFCGTHSILNLCCNNIIQTSRTGIPNTYLIHVVDNVYLSLIVLNRDEALLFNPAFTLINIPQELLNILNLLYKLHIVNASFINDLTLSYYCNAYFIEMFCYFSINDFTITNIIKLLFPKRNSFMQHRDNIIDFAKTRLIM